MQHLKSNSKRSRRWVLGAGAATLAFPSAARAALGAEDIAARARSRAVAGDSLAILLPEGARANVAPVVADFTRLTGIPVSLTEVAVDDVTVKLMLDNLMGEQTYDVALPPTFSLPDLATEGVITSLDELPGFSSVSGGQDTSLYQTGNTFDGSTYGFQTDGDAYIMFYNSDFLSTPDEASAYQDRFGTALDIPRTWDELDRQMAWFHRPDEGSFGGLLFRNSSYVAWEWWIRFHATGKWPLSPQMQPAFVSDQGIGALEAMIRSGEHLAPEAQTAGLFENWDRYAQGDVYANVGWGGSQKFFNRAGSKLHDKLIFGTTPGGMVGDELLVTPYFNWGWNYVVLTGTPRSELAMLFTAFATSPSMSTLAVRQPGGFFDPYRTEHYVDAGIRDTYSDPFLAIHRESLESAIPDLYLSRQGDYFVSLSKWLGRALSGTVSPEVALTRVEQQWNLITTEVGRDAQTKRWQDLRAKYPAQARTLLSDI